MKREKRYSYRYNHLGLVDVFEWGVFIGSFSDKDVEDRFVN